MKTPKKTTIETVKTIALTALLASIVSFGAGIAFEKRQTAEVKQAVSQATVAVTQSK